MPPREVWPLLFLCKNVAFSELPPKVDILDSLSRLDFLLGTTNEWLHIKSLLKFGGGRLNFPYLCHCQRLFIFIIN